MSTLRVPLDGSDVQFDGGEIDVLACLFLFGPTWDGYIPSKQGRDSLQRRGYVHHASGWASLTPAGVDVCVHAPVQGFRDQRWHRKQQGT